MYCKQCWYSRPCAQPVLPTHAMCMHSCRKLPATRTRSRAASTCLIDPDQHWSSISAEELPQVILMNPECVRSDQQAGCTAAATQSIYKQLCSLQSCGDDIRRHMKECFKLHGHQQARLVQVMFQHSSTGAIANRYQFCNPERYCAHLPNG